MTTPRTEAGPGCSHCGVPIAEHPLTDACAIEAEASADPNTYILNEIANNLRAELAEASAELLALREALGTALDFISNKSTRPSDEYAQAWAPLALVLANTAQAAVEADPVQQWLASDEAERLLAEALWFTVNGATVPFDQESLPIREGCKQRARAILARLREATLPSSDTAPVSPRSPADPDPG